MALNLNNLQKKGKKEEGAAASSSTGITALRQAAAAQGITGAAFHQQVQANAGAVRAAAGKQQAQNNPYLTEQQRNLTRGLVQQHPEVIQTTYDNYIRSGSQAFQALYTPGDSVKRMNLAKASLEDMRSSLITLQGLRQAFGRDVDDKFAESGISLPDTLQGYDRLIRAMAEWKANSSTPRCVHP